MPSSPSIPVQVPEHPLYIKSDTPLDSTHDLPATPPTSTRGRMDFADYILGLRDIYRMSQRDFAAKIGISPQYLCDLEQRRRMPSVAVVNKICDCFAPRGAAGDGFRKRYHRAGARAHGWMV